MDTKSTNIKLEDSNSGVEKFLISDLTPKPYSQEDLMSFTSNFSNIVGSGGYGVVYKGQFPDGVQIAVKVLEHKDFVEETFIAEVKTIGNAYHRNLVKLYGYCFEHHMKALVYEYMENGCLDKILYNNDIIIEWEKLYDISIEIAKGLVYLHDECCECIIHHDIKAGNVLLDKDLSPKITDFGLARLMERSANDVSLSRCRGNTLYNAPETWMATPRVSYKCDVYSFGMLLFEVLGKRRNGQGENWFPKQVWKKFEDGEVEQIIKDCGIKKKDREKAKILSAVALWCAQSTPERRPTMSDVVLMLQTNIPVHSPPYPFQWDSSILPSLEMIQEVDSKVFPAGARRIIPAVESWRRRWPFKLLFMTGNHEKYVWANGDVYIGEWINGKQVQGKYVWANGDVYIGELINGEREGHGKFTAKNGDYYEGTYRKSVKEGQGKYVCANGDVYIGEWINGEKEGHGKFTYKNGDYYEGTFRKSKSEGQGKYVWANGDVYIGEWINGDKEGYGKYVRPNGIVYIGEWINGEPEGHGKVTFKNGNYYEGTFRKSTEEHGKYVWANGDVYIGEWLNYEQEGHGKITYKNGDYYEGFFKNSIKEGHGKYVWAIGDVYIGEWINGKQEGSGKFTYKNGDYYEGTYRKSIEEGQGKYVCANGDVYIGEWINGEKEGHGKFTYKNGDCYEGTFRKSKREGQGKFVWANGDVYIGEWINGEKEGHGKYVWQNGDVYIGEWINGDQEGHGKYVWRNGDVYIGEWINGKKKGHGKYF